MTSYRITSSAGMDMGVYDGADEAEAIEAMDRDAGYESSEDAARALGTTVEALRAGLTVRPDVAPSIVVEDIMLSTTVETHGAVDAEVTIGAHSYAVTLVPAEYDGSLSMWGQRDHWISGEGVDDLSRGRLSEIEAAVRAAAKGAGLA